MARIHLCRLLREKTMQIEEPFQLLGAGPNSKILMTLQLRVCYFDLLNKVCFIFRSCVFVNFSKLYYL